MRKVDSQALGLAGRALGLSGAGAPVTEFLDGLLEQGIDVAPIIRRSRTFGITEGLFTGLIVNVHGIADSITTRVQPYNVGPVASIAPYPDDIPAGFELWLFSAVMRETGAGGGLTGALLSVQFASQGWGINNAGAQIVVSREHPLAFWDALITEQIIFGELAGNRGPYQRIGIRLPRSLNAAGEITELQWRTTSAAAATFEVQVLLGLFPIALGQDGLV